MDIQKENDKYLVSLVTNCGATQDEINDLNFDDETGFFESNRLADWFINQINFGWRVWQAAKAQAVPEGYKLVPIDSVAVNKKEIPAIREALHIMNFKHGDVRGDFASADAAIEKAIEATQEPAND